MILAASMILLASHGLLTFGTCRTIDPSDRNKALASLVEAERAFSRDADNDGIRQAFLTWLAPDAVIFQPEPVEARPVYEKMDPADPAVLSREPEVAEIASSGELGYTSGRYQFRPSRGAEPTGFGHYVSVWKKLPSGTWRVILDIGVQHGWPEPLATSGLIPPPPIPAPAGSLAPEKLRDEEHAFGIRAGSFDTEVRRRGMRKALAAFATDDLRFLRPGHFPAIGLRAARELLPASAGRMSRGWRPLKTAYQIGIAWSADLGYSYGTIAYEINGAVREDTAYLRIWRRTASGVWKISLDIELPVTPS